MSVGYRGSGFPGAAVDRNPGAASRIPEDPRPQTARERVAAQAWLAAWQLVRWLPEPAAFGLAEVAGRFAHRWWRGRRNVVRRNFERVVPAETLDDAVSEAFTSYSRYWAEACRAADLDSSTVDRRTNTSGFEHLDAVLDEGRGAVILLAHHGSWDIAARWGETHGYHLAVVAEVVRPRRVFETFVRLREAIGLEVVPLRRGEDLVGRLGKVLAANHLVGLLTDRDLSGRAPLVDFFGEPCRIPLGAAILAKRHGAPIVPITMLQRPRRRWHLQALPAISPNGLTVTQTHMEVVAALERLILLDPAQWHAFQPVWPSDFGNG